MRVLIVALLAAISYAQTATTQHTDSQNAHLVSFSSHCVEDFGTIGEFKSAVECGAAIQKEPEVCQSGLFMFSSKFNFWGCRCCSQKRDWESHDFWSIYSIRLPNRTQEVRQEDYFGQIQQVDILTGERSWINVLSPNAHSWKSDLIAPQETPQHYVEVAPIFVSIASFNDARCGKTLVNIFHRALFPSRIRVGIVGYGVHCVQQMCIEMGFDKCEPLKKQIYEVVSPLSSRRGFDSAHRVTKSFLGDEDFCMQAGSADDFVKGWDYSTIQEWQKTGNEFAILTTQAGSVEKLHNSNAELPVVCEPTVREGMPTWEKVSFAKDLKEPIHSTMYSGSFSFSRCDAWREVPHDPHMAYVDTHPETDHIQESLYGLRLWTHGYDFYAPSKIFSSHNADRPENSEYVHDRNAENRAKSLKRARMLMEDGHNLDLGQFKLGYERTIEQYAQFAGYDFKNKATADRFVACREAARIALGSGFFQSNPHANTQNNGLMKFAILPTIGVCAGAGTMLLYSQDYSDRQTRLEKQH